MTVHRVSTHHRESLDHGWQLRASPAGAIAGPDQLDAAAADDWVDAPFLGTAAAVLRAVGRWSLDGTPRRFDAEDWWYRRVVDGPAAASADAGEALVLGFDGLATLADAWLNGEHLLRSESMFLAHEVAAGTRLRPGANELVLRFAALDSALARRRPRPHWRAPMVEHQQLRWHRTTLLGRTPGWSPPAAPVGPWRPIWLERRSGIEVSSVRLRAELEGGVGTLAFSGALRSMSGRPIASVRLELERGGVVVQAHAVAADNPAAVFSASLVVADVAGWWPHTHGEPALYACRLIVHVSGAAEPVQVDLGRVGFRSVALETQDGGFALRVNGEAVFCRGACWTPLDVVSLRAAPGAVEAALAQVCAAGMNMIRIGGTMVYEDRAFLDACDALGVLVWQDFMFANMDYPDQDAPFMGAVRAEVDQQLAAWQGRPSLCVLCGNSEVEQQAAMWGAPRELWSPPLFHGWLAERCAEACPGVPYWPSSAHGGAFPHQANAGTTSYYGVGAYLRPLEDARRAELRFATECLAFANVPEAATLSRMPGGESLKVHHAGWKARTPRDLNAGWDFEDVRDHYLATLFGLDPARLRYSDHARYLSLSRIASGEAMAASFAEWRRPGSSCAGAFVWFLRDLWAGAGWGLVDDQGLPKACFRYLQRALQPVAVFISDEGTSGLVVHAINEKPRPLVATLALATHGDDDSRVFSAEREIRLPARGSASWNLSEWTDGFADLSYAFRFGPQAHRLVVTTLRGVGDQQGHVIAQDFCFPGGRPSSCEADLGLHAHGVRLADGRSAVRLETRRFAQAVHFESANFRAEDEYFHMPPGSVRTVLVEGLGGGDVAQLKGSVAAVNWRGTSAIGNPVASP